MILKLSKTTEQVLSLMCQLLSFNEELAAFGRCNCWHYYKIWVSWIDMIMAMHVLVWDNGFLGSSKKQVISCSYRYAWISTPVKGPWNNDSIVSYTATYIIIGVLWETSTLTYSLYKWNRCIKSLLLNALASRFVSTSKLNGWELFLHGSHEFSASDL